MTRLPAIGAILLSLFAPAGKPALAEGQGSSVPVTVVTDSPALFDVTTGMREGRLFLGDTLKFTHEIFSDGQVDEEELTLMRVLALPDGIVTLACRETGSTFTISNPDGYSTRLFSMLTKGKLAKDFDAYWLQGPWHMEDLVLLSMASPLVYRNVRDHIGGKLQTAWNKSKATGRYGALCQLLLDADKMMSAIPFVRPAYWQKNEFDARSKMRALLHDAMRSFDNRHFTGSDSRPTGIYDWLAPASGSRPCDPATQLVSKP